MSEYDWGRLFIAAMKWGTVVYLCGVAAPTVSLAYLAVLTWRWLDEEGKETL